MKKVVVQGALLVSMFILFWVGLSQINWVKIFQIEKTEKTLETKLGDLFWTAYSQSKTEIKNPKIVKPIDSLLTKICVSNNIDRSEIKLHIFESSEVNAFALPDRHLVINSALVLNTQTEAELCGVMGHEIAHIQLNHVMKSLLKEIGLSVLISITGGGGNAEAIKNGLKLLSSSAYDRSLEKEADIKAVDYLIKSNIYPMGFADFLGRLALNESNNQALDLLNTHPGSEMRAQYIVEHIGQQKTKEIQILSSKTWSELQSALNER